METEILYARASLIEKCADQISRRTELNFELLAQVGVWNRMHVGYSITLAEIHAYHDKLMALLASARTFRL